MVLLTKENKLLKVKILLKNKIHWGKDQKNQENIYSSILQFKKINLFYHPRRNNYDQGK